MLPVIAELAVSVLSVSVGLVVELLTIRSNIDFRLDFEPCCVLGYIVTNHDSQVSEHFGRINDVNR